MAPARNYKATRNVVAKPPFVHAKGGNLRCGERSLHGEVQRHDVAPLASGQRRPHAVACRGVALAFRARGEIFHRTARVVGPSDDDPSHSRGPAGRVSLAGRVRRTHSPCGSPPRTTRAASVIPVRIGERRTGTCQVTLDVLT